MREQSVQTMPLINKFDEIFKKQSCDGKPSWIQQLRETGLSRFTTLGFPHPKDEEWKNTNITPLLKHNFSLAANNSLIETKAYNDYCQTEKISLVFVNGLFNDQLSKTAGLPKGVVVKDLKEALKQNSSDIELMVSKYNAQEDSTFIALSNALIDHGAHIKIDKNVICESLIHIVHLTSGSHTPIITSPRTFIRMEKSSQATIMESHVSFNDEITYFANALTDILIEENAVLSYCKAQKESLKAFHIGNTRVWQEKNSTFNGFSLVTGTSITRNNLDIVLNGEGCHTSLNGLYSLSGTQHADNHTMVDHRFENGTSNQLYKGILNGSSHAVFNGKILVRPRAQLTNSYQLNKNLLIGPHCQVNTKPQLEIFADDVKCTHGATIGQLDQDEIFYLQSRGISRTESVRILSKGFVDALVNEIKDATVNKRLHILLEPSYSQF